MAESYAAASSAARRAAAIASKRSAAATSPALPRKRRRAAIVRSAWYSSELRSTGARSTVSSVRRSFGSRIHRLEKSHPLSAVARMFRYSASRLSADTDWPSAWSSRNDSGRGSGMSSQ